MQVDDLYTVKLIMNDKKILIIRKDHGIHGGIENQIIMLCSFLQISGFTVHFLSNNKHSRLSLKLTDMGVVTHESELNKILSSAIKIITLCRKEKITTVQCHMFRESIMIRVAKLLYPRLKTIFRVHTYIDASNISNSRKKIYHILDFITSPLINKYISINLYNINEMTAKSCINYKKIVQICNPKEKIGEYSIPALESPYTIAMIANFVDMKGHDILIKALDILKKQNIIINVIFLGSVDDSNEINSKYYQNFMSLINLLDVNDQVTLLGYVDIYDTIKNIPIIVLPSYAEGTPNSIIEAMSIGKIVICSNVGGIPEFITDGYNGYIHKSGDYVELAKKIKLVFSLNQDQIAELSKNAYKSWKEKFNPEDIRVKYIKEINELSGD